MRSGGLALLGLMAMTGSADARQGPDTVDVLFIGNSYTYYHNLPAIVEALAAAEGAGPRVRARMLTEGGACLADHWRARDGIRDLAAADPPDFVVLQAQSTFCRTFLVHGVPRVGDASEYLRPARLYADAAREAGAVPVLLAHWKREDAPEWDQWAVDRAVFGLAEEVGARPLPAGDAFQAALRRRPDLRLYEDDHSHPAPAGSLLTAMTLYTVVTGRPAPAVGRVDGPAVDDDGVAVGDSAVVLVHVPDEVAALLAEAAAAAVANAPRELPFIPAPARPTPPRGVPVETQRLRGTWRGPLDVYPFPGVLTLVVDSAAAGWSIAGRIEFGGRPDDIVPDFAEVTRTPAGLRFLDPAGPNGGTVRYEGAFTGDELAGIAEIVAGGGAIYAVGEWRLRKKER